MVRDVQKSRVYNWDWSLPQGPPMSLVDCRTLVRRVWERYPVPNCFSLCDFREPPKIVDGRGTRTATGSATRINLPIWSRNRITVLHEVAHGIIHHYCYHAQQWPQWASHGPEFCRVEVELLVRFGGLERKLVLAEAKKRFVKIASRKAVQTLQSKPAPKRLRPSPIEQQGTVVLAEASADRPPDQSV